MHNELVTEVFKKLKKNKLQAVEYDAKQVKKEITDIMNITKSLMSKPEYKEVYKHGMNMSSMSDTMQDKVPENGKYKSGENFWIVRFDLHKFTKCDPRNPENDGYKKHPVEEASEKLKAEVKSLVNKKYPHYDVEVDGDWDTFALEVVLKNGNVVKESSDTEINSEPLMELFGKLKKNKKDQHDKKHPLPARVSKPAKKTYPQDQIVKEIKDILAFSKKVISKPEYKEFLNKGAELVPFYTAMDMSASSMSEMELVDEYETNDDFPVIDFDLWDYPKCGARTHEDEGYETHPVDDASMKMCTEIREYVNKKYPHYNVEVDGDWDTYSIMLTLK